MENKSVNPEMNVPDPNANTPALNPNEITDIYNGLSNDVQNINKDTMTQLGNSLAAKGPSLAAMGHPNNEGFGNQTGIGNYTYYSLVDPTVAKLSNQLVLTGRAQALNRAIALGQEQASNRYKQAYNAYSERQRKHAEEMEKRAQEERARALAARAHAAAPQKSQVRPGMIKVNKVAQPGLVMRNKYTINPADYEGYDSNGKYIGKFKELNIRNNLTGEFFSIPNGSKFYNELVGYNTDPNTNEISRKVGDKDRTGWLDNNWDAMRKAGDEYAAKIRGVDRRPVF